MIRGGIVELWLALKKVFTNDSIDGNFCNKPSHDAVALPILDSFHLADWNGLVPAYEQCHVHLVTVVSAATLFLCQIHRVGSGGATIILCVFHTPLLDKTIHSP